MEWVVDKQLMQHINSNNLDNPLQSPYKTGYSTEIPLLHVKNKRSISHYMVSLLHLFLIDLMVAFDTNDHTTFVNCLKSWFGVYGTAMNWFTFLSHRFQAIKIGQPSLNCVSCLEFHKALSLVLRCSCSTPFL